MRAIGLAERALSMMCQRAVDREAFGDPLADQGVVREWIARSRIEIDQIRLLTLKAAWLMDTRGNAAARSEVAAIKVAAMEVAHTVVEPRRADLRRRRGQRRHRAGPAVRDHPGAADRRRTQRGAPAHDRQPRARGLPADDRRRSAWPARSPWSPARPGAWASRSRCGLAEAGATVVVSSRKADACEAAAAAITKATGVAARPAGPARRAVGRHRARRSTGSYAELGRLDVLVNNAGIAPLAPSRSSPSRRGCSTRPSRSTSRARSG